MNYLMNGMPMMTQLAEEYKKQIVTYDKSNVKPVKEFNLLVSYNILNYIVFH